MQGILPSGVSLFAGPPKLGKTRLAFNVATGISYGGTVVLGSIPVEPGEVLYIALDDPKRRLHEMYVKICEQPNSAPSKSLYIVFKWPRLGEGGEVALDQWLESHPDCRLVVLDVLKHFRPVPKNGGKNQNLYTEDYAIGDLLRPIAERHNVAILVNHHTNKLAYQLQEGDDKEGKGDFACWHGTAATIPVILGAG